jgi:formylglycine-generating enzyme required for sulfatase activity
VRVLQEVPLSPLQRAEAGNVLAQLGDPRFREDAWCLPDEPLLGFVEVPAGPFLMGTRREDIPALLERFGGKREYYEDETPQHEVTLPAYYVARYPVTHAQYAAFVREMGHEPPRAFIEAERPYEWREGNYPSQRANQPVVLATCHDALAYCRWLTGKLRAWPGTPEPLATLLREEGWVITLPSEAEWEKAARGGEQIPNSKSQIPRQVENPDPGRVFPWDSNLDPNRANYADTGIGATSAVGCFPGGASPYGVEDLSGNVWEWTRSLYRGYPYDPGDGREDLEAGQGMRRVLRGGAFLDGAWLVRCACRYWVDPDVRFRNFGFRVLASPIHL